MNEMRCKSAKLANYHHKEDDGRTAAAEICVCEATKSNFETESNFIAKLFLKQIIIMYVFVSVCSSIMVL